MKRVIAIHDMSGIGKASLTVAIPILSSMGLTVSPLPTAVLSSITGQYQNYAFVDLTAFMRDSIRQWRNIDIKADWIYSGFLGNPQQIDLILELKRMYPDAILVVDPVLGDDGRLYETMTHEIVESMKRLVSKADIITPNYTEAGFLLDRAYDNPADMCKALADMGAKRIIITSAPDGNGRSNCISSYCSLNGTLLHTRCDYVPTTYSGTGDIFTSVLVGCLNNGSSFEDSIKKAADFITIIAKNTYNFDPNAKEIILERYLHLLMNECPNTH